MLDLSVSLILIGLIAGALARLVVLGKQNLSILMTAVLGIVGSIVGGFLGYLIFPNDAVSGFFQPGGITGSIIGASIVLLIWARTRTRTTRTRVNGGVDRCLTIDPHLTPQWGRWKALYDFDYITQRGA